MRRMTAVKKRRKCEREVRDLRQQMPRLIR